MTRRIRRSTCACARARRARARAHRRRRDGSEARARRRTTDGVIKACRHKSGFLLVPSAGKTCKRSEQALSWNVAGAGRPGRAAGATGSTARPGRPARALRAAAASGRGQARPGPPGLQALPGRAARSRRSRRSNGIACTTSDDDAGRGLGRDRGRRSDRADVRGLRRAAPAAAARRAPSSCINEIDYDQVGADSGGFVEIFNAGDAAADLTGIALVLVDGGDGAEYQRRALTGTLAAGAYLVVEVDAQNGAPDGVALIDADGTLLDALSYEGAIEAATIGGATYDLVEGTLLPAATADSNTIAGSLSRIPNGERHRRRGHGLGVHVDRDPGSSERRLSVTPARRLTPRQPAASTASLREHSRAALGAGLAPALALLGLEALVEPALEVRELALELLVARPALGRRACRSRAPPARRSRARCRARSRRSGTAPRAPRRRRTSPRARPPTPRAGARACPACRARARRRAAARAGGGWSCAGPRRRPRGSPASRAAPRRRACSRASTCRRPTSRAARRSGPARGTSGRARGRRR